jgi:hypothetical protein
VHGRVTLSLIALVACLAAFAAPASAAPTTTLTITTTLLDQPAGHPWAIGLGVGATVANPDGSQPPALRRFQVKFPSGAKTHFDAFPACSLKSLETRKAPDGCPAASRIGGGTSGVSAQPIFPTPLLAKLDVFNGARTANGARQVLFLARTTTPLSVQMVFSGTIRRTTGRFGYVLDVSIPRIPTIGGLPDASPVSFNTVVQARRRGVSYLEAPTRCPKGGLPFFATFGFADGSSSTSRAHISCTLTSVPN